LTDKLWGLEFQWIYFYYTKLCVSDLTYRNETRNQSISDILQAAELPFLRCLQDTDKKSQKSTVLRKRMEQIFNKNANNKITAGNKEKQNSEKYTENEVAE
jgi:hypothetical protein